MVGRFLYSLNPLTDGSLSRHFDVCRDWRTLALCEAAEPSVRLSGSLLNANDLFDCTYIYNDSINCQKLISIGWNERVRMSTHIQKQKNNNYGILKTKC